MTLRAQRAEAAGEPVLTVAIPAYGNWDHLRLCLGTVLDQSVTDYEVFVSEDCSNDDRTDEVVAQLRASGVDFQVHRQERNLGYDGNVRFCLTHARGRHVLLLGHDDGLASRDEVASLVKALDALGYPEVAFTDVEDWATGTRTGRAAATAILGSGVDVAIGHFRTFSFVGGLIFQRAAATRHDTARWDRSIYVQIYLACRIIATGGRLASIDRTAVRKDIRIDDRTVETYATKLARQPATFRPRHTGIDSVIRVTVDAIEPGVSGPARSNAIRRVATDVMLYSYLYWLFEYRRVGGLKAAVGVARTSTPGTLVGDYVLTPLDRALVHLLYGGVTAVGLIVPGTATLQATRRLAARIRRRRQAVAR